MSMVAVNSVECVGFSLDDWARLWSKMLDIMYPEEPTVEPFPVEIVYWVERLYRQSWHELGGDVPRC